MNNAFARGLLAGLVGAVAVTVVHQLGRATMDHPPRMDVLGRRAVRRGARPFGVRLRRSEAQRWALVGDLVSNALYYAIAARGAPERAPWRGVVLGGLAGVGGIVLPGVLGLGTRPSRARPSTSAMTVAWYAIGGLAAGLAARRLGRERGDPDLRARLAANVFV